MLDSPVDRIKAKLDLVEIIQEYVQLKKAGANYKALCPFHHEKTPSFMASQEKQIWRCFGCNEGGDIFSFVMKMEGMEFAEALRLLAGKAGVQLKKNDREQQSKRNMLYDICEISAKFFHQLLLKHEKAAHARDYIKKRGLIPEIVEQWQIGYAADSWDVLSNFLKQKGFSDQEILLAGMTVKKERGEGFYDRFRNRLMFPISDGHGRVVGFTARVLDESRDKLGKYINTPQTAIYSKGNILYGLDKAKTEIKKQKLAVIVEGNMDVISSHQAGVSNVVASSGTALTENQAALLKRLTENIALAFDADLAGETAALRGIEVALRQGLNVKVITIPDGKDPDDCVRNNPQDWKQAIANAVPIMEYYFSKAFEGKDLSKVEHKKEAAKFLLARIAKLSDAIEQTHYLQKLSSRIAVSEEVLRQALPKSGAKRQETASVSRSIPKKDRHQILSQLALALIQKTKDSAALTKLQPELISVGLTQDLYKNLLIYYNQVKDHPLDNDTFWLKWEENLTDEKLIEYRDQLLLLLDKEFEGDTDWAKELDKVIFELKKLFFSRQSEQIAQQLEQAERVRDKEKINQLARQFNEITKELMALKAGTI